MTDDSAVWFINVLTGLGCGGLISYLGLCVCVCVPASEQTIILMSIARGYSVVDICGMQCNTARIIFR